MRCSAAALPDGSRLHVVIPDVTRRHWAINIRKFVVKASRLEHLVDLGTLTPQSARFLGAAVASGLNILVSGATQAGKTTMLNCLAASIGSREWVITVEEIFELQFPLRDVVGLQCRQPNLEGEGEIPLRRLVKEALRMRPDRLVVGEVREAESLDMLIALNSGLLGYRTHQTLTVVPKRCFAFCARRCAAPRKLPLDQAVSSGVTKLASDRYDCPGDWPVIWSRAISQ